MVVVQKVEKQIYLVFEVVPPVRPGLLNASLLLYYGVSNNGAQDTEGHSHTMIIVTMNTGTILQLWDTFSNDLEPIVELNGLNSEFGCRTRFFLVNKSRARRKLVTYPAHPS